MGLNFFIYIFEHYCCTNPWSAFSIKKQYLEAGYKVMIQEKKGLSQFYPQIPLYMCLFGHIFDFRKNL